MNLKNKIEIKTNAVLFVIVLAALSRLILHVPNFTPIGAMALFGAAYFRKKYLAFIIPIMALWLSDLVLNNLIFANLYPEYYTSFRWIGDFWVYAGFIAITAMGFLFFKKVNPTKVLGASVVASLIFFLLSNFGAWVAGGMYPMNLAGLLLCYGAGIEFFWNTLAGNLFFTAAFFGIFELVKINFPSAIYSFK